MTFGKHLLRGAALSALAVGLTTTSASAQANGSNFQVYSNGLDVIYLGLGAGPVGGWLPSDGFGSWFAGEDLKGATKTFLGDWGYKHIGWRESMCVLGSGAGPFTFGQLAIIFPNIAFVEFDGRNGHAPDVFTAPSCSGPTPSFIPYGTPAGTSFNLLISGFPSGAGVGSSLTLLLPNNGLVPSSAGGQAFLIANSGLAALGIGSTGFCWVVDFNWSPSALVSYDDIDGWWKYNNDSPDGNQYWGYSFDELNAWQSQTIAMIGGVPLAFYSGLDYEYHAKQIDPSTNSALQPAGFTGAGVYYATTVDAGGGNPGGPAGAGVGFDLGRHLAWDQSGTGGVINPNTGLGAQDPAGSPIPNQIPSIGVATWNNEDYNNTGSPTGGWRLTWLTIDWDAAFAIDPALAGEATKWFAQVRIPSTIPASVPVPWPQTITTIMFPFLVHNTVNHNGTGIWPDPNGFASGTFGVPGVNGTSIHLPLPLGSVCIGVPIAIQHGTTGLGGPGGPLVWSPNGVPGFPTLGNAASTSAQLHYLD